MRYVFKKKLLVFLVSIFDLFGYVLFVLAKVFVRKDSKTEPSSILLIRMDHIGDIVLALGVIKPLRDKYPKARIDFLAPVWASELILGNPNVDNVLDFDPPWFARTSQGIVHHLKAFSKLTELIKANKYDLVIDLRGDLRHILAMFLAGVKTRISYGITGGGFLLTDIVPYVRLKHESQKNLSLLGPLGINVMDSEIKIYYDKTEQIKTAVIKEEAGIVGPYVIIHAVPGVSFKKWSTTNFCEVIKYLRDIKKVLPVFIGSDKDKVFIQEIIGFSGGGVVDLSGKTKLKSISKLIEDAALFIGVDSGPAHIAGATETPGIVLFSGIHDEEQWAPAGKNFKIICPGKNRNLSEVSSAEVCRAVDDMLGIKKMEGANDENRI